MGICYSKERSSFKNVSRSNKVRDQSSFTAKEQQSTFTERKPAFTVSRDEAEKLLVNAKQGAYLLSQDVSSEQFISISYGPYVSHHAISKTSNGVSVGGEYFESVSEMLDYFKAHPLGSTKLISEYTTPQSSLKKEIVFKTTSGKSENSMRLNSVSSPDNTSERSVKSLKHTRQDNFKSDIETLPEEEVAQAAQADHDDHDVVKPGSLESVKAPEISAAEASVSSAGDLDYPSDEPLPVLPGPDGDKPPPLFPGLAAKTFTMLGFKSFLHGVKMNSIRDSTYENRENQSYGSVTRMIKVVVCGKPDTSIEQEYLMQDCLPKLAEFCYKFGFVCDIIHLNSSETKHCNKEWVIENTESGLSSTEFAEMKAFRIPLLVLGCFGEKMGPLTIPREICAKDFEKMVHLLPEDKKTKFRQLYEKDENYSNPVFALKKDVDESNEKIEELLNIFKIFSTKCFEGEKDLWKHIQPETERNVKSLISNFDNIVMVPIERKLTDIRKCERHSSSVQEYEDTHDGNFYYQLEAMRQEFRKQVIRDAGLKDSDIITVSATVSSVKIPEQRGSYKQTIDKTLMPFLENKLVRIMKQFPCLDASRSCLRDEMYTHMFERQRRSKEFVSGGSVMSTIKAYLQGPYTKPLILYGESGCGRSSVIAKASQMAKEWICEGASIIARFIGSTRDSTSLHLLLQSICLELSLAYQTDPAAVPQSMHALVEFLPTLFQFATDSQPLVMCIAALDDVGIFDEEYSYFSFIPSTLLPNVKVIISVHEDKLTSAQAIYQDSNSYKKMPSKTVEDGIEMLDSMLVAAERTLSEQQKTAISSSLSSCWSPVYVNILFHQAKSWRSNDIVNVPPEVNLQNFICEIFSKVEKEHGYEDVKFISSVITASHFGITKRCLCHTLLNSKVILGLTSPSNADSIVSAILKSLSCLISAKWLNGQIVYTWFHAVIRDVAKERYLKELREINDITIQVVQYYINEPNMYEDVSHVQESVLSEAPATQAASSDNLSQNPSSFSFSNQDIKHKASQNSIYNLQRIQFLPFYLMRCSTVVELKKHALCSYDFLHDKLRASSVGHLLNDFYYALAAYSQDIDFKIMKEFFELANEALANDPEQLPAQIFSRLYPTNNEKCQIPAVSKNLLTGQIEYCSSIEKKMLPPPDGKDSTSSEASSSEEEDPDDVHNDDAAQNEDIGSRQVAHHSTAPENRTDQASEPSENRNNVTLISVEAKQENSAANALESRTDDEGLKNDGKPVEILTAGVQVTTSSHSLLTAPANNFSAATAPTSVLDLNETTGSAKEPRTTAYHPSTSSSRNTISGESHTIESPVLTALVNNAVQRGHLLLPSKPCLIRPPSECGAFSESQMMILSSQTSDVRLMFIDKHPENFVTWSKSKQTIALYNATCTCLKQYVGLKLTQVLLAVNFSVIVEMLDGRVVLFDLSDGDIMAELDSQYRYFAVSDTTHVIALSDNWTCLCVCNLRNKQVEWNFRAPEGRNFHNVLVSKNGAIGVCILEAETFNQSREDLVSPEELHKTPVSSQDEIIVVNLKSRQQLHKIALKNGQYFHKVCAISEDGHYLVHLTEPDYQILVLDLIKGTFVREMETRLHRILKILVSTQGNCILYISADSVLRVWNLSDGELRYSLCEPTRSIRGGYMDDTHCLGMSEDGSRAVHSVKSQFYYSYVVLWDLVQGRQLATFTTDFYGLSYQISPLGDYLVTSMPSGLVTLGAKEHNHLVDKE